MNNTFGFYPSNTFESVNFDVFNIDGVEDPLINVNKLATLDFEECYFSQAVAFINECNDEYTNNKIKLYHNISESSSQAVVLESFSDFFVRVKEIINKFLKFIKSLFNRFSITIARMIDSENYLKKRKKDFSNFKDENKFKIEGFEYTFSENIPLSQAVLGFNNSLFDKLYGDENNNLTAEGIKQATISINLEEDCDEFRARVIGRDDYGRISITDFPDELFKVYRNNTMTASTIEVNHAYIMKVVDRFFDSTTIRSSISRQYKQIEDAYRKVESQIKDIVSRNGDLNAKEFLERLPDDNGITQIDNKSDLNNYTIPGNIMSQLDMYVKAKVDQIQEYSNIHILAFAAKLDAIKECTIQDKNTLYTALSKL